MTKSKIFLYFCLFFICGILISSIIDISRPVWLGILILGTLLVVFSKYFDIRCRNILVAGFCLLILAGGIIRHQLVLTDNITGEITKYYNQEVSFKGVVVQEPERRISHQKFQFKTKQIPGKILITTNLYPEYEYGDKLEIKGELKQPVQFDSFDYRAYLTKDKIYSVIYSSNIKLIAKNKGNWFYQKVFGFKNKLRNIIDQTLLPPHSSILKAIFLGDKYGLSDQLKEKLNISGTRHIVAISGMHIPITL